MVFVREYNRDLEEYVDDQSSRQKDTATILDPRWRFQALGIFIFGALKQLELGQRRCALGNGDWLSFIFLFRSPTNRCHPSHLPSDPSHRHRLAEVALIQRDLTHRSRSVESKRWVGQPGSSMGERRHWQVREGCWSSQHCRRVRGRVPRSSP